LTSALGKITQREPFKGALAQLVERFAGSEDMHEKINKNNYSAEGQTRARFLHLWRV